MELKNLIREDGGRAVVEAGSEAEANLRSIGFVGEDEKKSERGIDEFTKAELVELAESLKLDASGNKADLVARINAAQKDKA